LHPLANGEKAIATGSSPRRKAAAVTPHDTTTFDEPSILWIGVGGDLRVLPWDNADPVTFKNVPTGPFDQREVKKVLATGTTASEIIREFN
jgi:hypothetical protein